MRSATEYAKSAYFVLQMCSYVQVFNVRVTAEDCMDDVWQETPWCAPPSFASYYDTHRRHHHHHLHYHAVDGVHGVDDDFVIDRRCRYSETDVQFHVRRGWTVTQLTVYNTHSSSVVLVKIFHATPACWRFTTTRDRQTIELLLRCEVCLQFYQRDDPYMIAQLVDDNDEMLFAAVMHNDKHV